MSRETYSNLREARHFLNLQGFRQEPGMWYAWYHRNGRRAALTPSGRQVMVIYR